jgi:hypothetical protein
VKRRATQLVTAIQERRIGVEKLADAFNIAPLCGLMDRMIWAGRDSSASAASLFENPGDILMSPVARHFDEATVVETIPLRVHALIEQKLHHRKMAGAHGEVYGMCVEILCPAQSRVAPK